MDPTTIKLREAIRRMRQLSAANIPFSFSFISYSETSFSSDGYKTVSSALLRPGYREDQSSYANILIAYTDFSDKECERQFFLPLLMTFNQLKVVP